MMIIEATIVTPNPAENGAPEKRRKGMIIQVTASSATDIAILILIPPL